MSDENHTREELADMNRLHLRRICKKKGMSSTDCAQMDFDDMVEWILEQQGEDDGGKKTAKKTTKKAPAKKAPAKGKSASAKGGKSAPAKSKSDEGTADVGDPGELEGKIDTIGSMLDENFGAVDENIKGLTQLVNDLAVEVYQVKGLILHMGAWLEDESILTADSAPDGFGFQEKLAELEAECQGEDEGGEDE